MLWVLAGFSLYLTYYTFCYARSIQKQGNKWAGMVVILLSGCYIPLCSYLWFNYS